MAKWQRQDKLSHDILWVLAVLYVFILCPVLAPILIWRGYLVVPVIMLVSWIPFQLLTRKYGPYDIFTTHYKL